MPEFNQSFSVSHARRARAKRPEVALIGSRASFSDNLVRATGQHLRDLMLLHLPTIEAFNELPPDCTRTLRLLVIDDSTLCNAPDDVVRSLACPASTILVLAFLDYRIAAAFYAAATKALPIHSYVPLDVRLDVWLSIIRLLLLGGKYIPEELVMRCIDGRRAAHAGQGPHGLHGSQGPGVAMPQLTPRQNAVLQMVASGMPNKVIATRLGLSDHTVKLHIHNIIAKLGVANRTEAAARYYDDAQ